MRFPAAFLSALLAASPASAQVRLSRPVAAVPTGLGALAPAPALAVSVLPAASAPLPSAAPALSALPAAAAPAPVRPSAPSAAPAERRGEVLGDPAQVARLDQSARALWGKVPESLAGLEREYRAAVEAADHTHARDVLDRAVESSRRELGRRAFARSGIAEEAARLKPALALPDHPAVAAARRGLERAMELEKEGRRAAAMAAADRTLRESSESPLPRTSHRWTLTTPLIKLQSRLREKAFDVYDAPKDARELQLAPTAAATGEWLRRRRAADPASVVGDYDGRPIETQRFADCAVRSLWNLPALARERARTTYDGFLARAESVLGEEVRAEGLSEHQSRRLLESLGFARSYDRAPKGEADLLQAIADHGALLGGYDFPVRGWRALLSLGRFSGRYSHAVVVTAAVRQRGRWWFVVVDPSYRHPRLFSWGELLTLGLKVATVTPRP